MGNSIDQKWYPGRGVEIILAIHTTNALPPDLLRELASVFHAMEVFVSAVPKHIPGPEVQEMPF